MPRLKFLELPSDDEARAPPPKPKETPAVLGWGCRGLLRVARGSISGGSLKPGAS
jgi:hypothetical protein